MGKRAVRTLEGLPPAPVTSQDTSVPILKLTTPPRPPGPPGLRTRRRSLLGPCSWPASSWPWTALKGRTGSGPRWSQPLPGAQGRAKGRVSGGLLPAPGLVLQHFGFRVLWAWGEQGVLRSPVSHPWCTTSPALGTAGRGQGGLQLASTPGAQSSQDMNPAASCSRSQETSGLQAVPAPSRRERGRSPKEANAMAGRPRTHHLQVLGGSQGEGKRARAGRFRAIRAPQPSSQLLQTCGDAPGGCKARSEPRVQGRGPIETLLPDRPFSVGNLSTQT